MDHRFFPCFLLAAGLVASACDSTAVERRKSIYELQADPTPGSIEKLHALTGDPDRDVRATALNVLVGLEVDDASELALRGLGDEDGFVRATAAKLVADVGDRALLGPLARVLTDDSYPMARQRAAEALARFGGLEAIEALARGLEDPMPEVRLASIRGLRGLDPGYAKTTLSRLLIDDEVWEIRAQAAQVLGLTGDPEVVAMLEAAVDDENEFVRSAATNALRVHEKVRGGGGE